MWPSYGSTAPGLSGIIKTSHIILITQIYLNFNLQASIPLERAVGEATGKLMKQPGLLLIGDSYFLKMETDAVKLDVGGLPDALAHLVASYYIFNCVYPENLKFVFGFFERVFDLSVEVRTVKRNVTISDFVMKVAAHVSNNDDML